VANAFFAKGISYKEDEVIKLGKVKAAEGMSERVLKRVVKALGGEGWHFNLPADLGWSCVQGCLSIGQAVILLVDEEEHWVAAVGAIGTRVLVADPAHNELVLSYSREELIKRTGEKVYGIAV
jgi:hypothetical protein